MSAGQAVRILLLATSVAGCGVAVRSDRAAIGGGAAQATAQAQARFQATMGAATTAGAQVPGGAQSCECDATGK